MRHRLGLFAILFAVVVFSNAACLPMVQEFPFSPSSVMVHASVESPEPGVILHKQIGTNPVRRKYGVEYERTYSPVCEAPCEVDLNVGQPLYVSGRSFSSSQEFILTDASSPVNIKVRPVSWMRESFGPVFVFAGVTSVMSGALINVFSDFSDPRQSSRITAGFSTIGVGVIAITLGAVLLKSQTTVDIWRAPAPSLAPPARWPSPESSVPSPPR